MGWWDEPPESAPALSLTITLDVAGGGYLVELRTPELWPHAGDVYSQTLINLERIPIRADRDALGTARLHSPAACGQTRHFPGVRWDVS